MKAKLIARTIQSLAPQARAYDVRDTELQGFLLRVQPTGAMTYFCEYRRPDGRKTRLKLGVTSVLSPAQARDEAMKALGDCARGEDPGVARKVARQETLAAFIEQQYRPWAETHRKWGASAVKQVLSCFDEFKNQRLSEVSAWKIEKWRSARLKSGKKATTVNRNIAGLKAILQKAVLWDAIPANPLAKVKAVRTDSSAKVRFLSPAEEGSLRAALDKREEGIRAERRSHNTWCKERGYPLFADLDAVAFADHIKPMALLSMNTGMRRGEVFSLKWDDVDFTARTLTVVGETTKNGKTRHIPLNVEALQTLQGLREQSRHGAELVFESHSGQRFDNIKKGWQAVLTLAGIRDFRWHDLRHHFASMLVMRGVDLNTVRELLGHGDLKMTLRYAHLAPHVKAEAVAKLDLRRPIRQPLAS